MALEAAVHKRLADWRDKLIDLSRANRLLNYSPRAASSIRVVEEDPQEIAELVLAGKTLVFDAMAEDYEPLADGALRTGDLRLQTTLEATRLHKVLTRLYRESRASVEEQGFNTLHLGLGLLTFTTPEDPRGFRAPLLLLPVELRRRGARSDFKLHLYDDEPQVNPALILKLHRDHGIELNLPEPEEELTYERLKIAFAPACKALANASIEDEIHLGLFSFAKIPLYNDLLEHEEVIGAHPIAAALACGQSFEADGVDGLPRPEEVETANDSDETFQILDADSSQQAAILAARRGRSFVLQGPPGTGKSQTISNIIAEALAAKRTVLFVSEKMAALEVVQRRLDAAGLGAFCLELHSRKANKREVVQSLASAWQQWSKAAGKEEGTLAEIGELRELLGRYVEALHEPRGAAGFTAFEILGNAARYRSVPECTFPIHSPLAMDRPALKQIEQRLRTMTPLRAAVEPAAIHPWRASKRRALGVSTLEEAQRTLNLFLGQLDALERAQSELASALGQERPGSLKAADELAALAARLLDTTSPPDSWVGETDWAGLSPRVKRALTSGVEFAALHAALLTHYEVSVLELDAADLKRRARPGGFVFGWFRRRGARKSLAACSKGGASDLAADVASLLRHRALKAEVQEADAALLQAFGNQYEGPGGNFEALAAHVAWIEELRGAWPAALALNDEIRAAVRGEGHAVLEKACGDLATERAGMLERLAQVGAVLELDEALAWGGDFESASLPEIREQAEAWQERRNDWPAWVAWQGARGEAEEAGLGDYLERFDQRGLEAHDLLDGWFRTWWHTAADELLQEIDELRAFDGRQHDGLVERFRTLDAAQIEAARTRVAARLRAAVPPPGVRQVGGSEPGTLKREIGKQRRHLPTRVLLDRIPQLLRLLKPCLMMSPLSVATYLPPGKRLFDLVVFDEASQICTEDGVGAITRGNQVIVCGDSKQLPPTRFFERRLEDDDDAPEDVLVDLQSILEECGAGTLPEIQLKWHYRSRDESLINFSNRHFYGGNLVTFPNAARDAADLGISYEAVPDGVYHPGPKGSRSNPIEAAAVADRVFQILETRPEDSVGVVTFSTTQRDEVLDAMDARRREGESFDERFDREGLEPVFVKNLEAVQGDERDVIIFSVGYARDPEGTLRLNFGPLNKEGGDRRLNVAVTRARKQVIVCSSLPPEEIDTSRAKGRGSRLLRSYMETAQRGMAIEESEDHDKEAPEVSALLDSIRRELAARGFEADLRLGNSEFKVDLAVRDPDRPGRYLLAILCDGPAYAGEATTRDRERTRCDALGRLGWRVHRIWAPDWVRSAGREVERIASAIDEARAGVVEPAVAPAPAPTPSAAEPFDFDAEVEMELPGVGVYKAANLRLRGPAAEFHAVPLSRLASALQKVIQVEGPLHRELAARRLALAWGITRSTSKVMDRFDEALDKLVAEGSAEQRGEFIWGLPAGEVVVRAPADGVQREIDEIPPEELAACVLLVVDAYLGLPRDGLLREVARAFGFSRLGDRISATIEPVVQSLLESGALRVDDERIARVEVERASETDSGETGGDDVEGDKTPGDGAPEAVPV